MVHHKIEHLLFSRIGHLMNDLSYEIRNIKEIHSESGQAYTFIDSASRSQIKIIFSLFCSQMPSVWNQGVIGWNWHPITPWWNCHSLISIIIAYFHA